MFTVDFKDDLSELRNQIFINEKLIKVTFFGVYKQASHRFKQKVEYFIEIYIVANFSEVCSFVFFGFDFGLNFIVLFNQVFKQLEKHLNVAGTYFK